MVIKLEETMTVSTATDVTLTIAETEDSKGDQVHTLQVIERKTDDRPKSFLSSIMKREAKTVDRLVIEIKLTEGRLKCEDLLEYAMLTGAFQYSTEFRLSLELDDNKGQIDLYLANVREFLSL